MCNFFLLLLQEIDESPIIATYLSLTIGSFATILVPYFKAVAHHGKRLNNTYTKEKEKEIGEVSLLDKFNLITIPKYYFIFMYLFSLICCSIVIYCHLKSKNMNNNALGLLWRNQPLIILFSFHSLRRFLECIYITIYGTSVMHLIGFIVGLTHYAITVLNLANKQIYAAKSEYDIDYIAHDSSLHTHLYLPHSIKYLALLLFIFASIMQHRFHMILYRIKHKQVTLKKADEDEDQDKDHPSLFRYEVPRGSWFQYCCCPHYTSEILIYISLVSLHPDPTSWYMLLWVVSNLAVVAMDTLRWYQSHAQLRNQIPRHWKALIPGVF